MLVLFLSIIVFVQDQRCVCGYQIVLHIHKEWDGKGREVELRAAKRELQSVQGRAKMKETSDREGRRV